MDRDRKRKGYRENGNKELREMRMGEKRPKEREKNSSLSKQSFSLTFPTYPCYLSIILAICAPLLLCLTHLLCPTISEKRNTYFFSCPEATQLNCF